MDDFTKITLKVCLVLHSAPAPRCCAGYEAGASRSQLIFQSIHFLVGSPAKKWQFYNLTTEKGNTLRVGFSSRISASLHIEAKFEHVFCFMEWHDGYSFYGGSQQRWWCQVGIEVGTLPGRLQRHGRGGSSPAPHMAPCFSMIQEDFSRVSWSQRLHDPFRMSWGSFVLQCPEKMSILCSSFEKKLAQVHHGGALLEDVRAEAWWMGCQMRTVHRRNWLLRGSMFFLDDKAITWYYMLFSGPSIWSITMGQRKESCPWAMRPWFSHKCQLLPCNLAASVAFSIFGRPESKFGSPKERGDGRKKDQVGGIDPVGCNRSILPLVPSGKLT